MGFNPRAREGRDMALSAAFSPRNTFQSTRPRGARLEISDVICNYLDVSIHAPARGATCILDKHKLLDMVSIHAPARGATRTTSAPICTRSSFNPRAREGRDRPNSPLCHLSCCFNPRAREGRDIFALRVLREGQSFNPRAREGRDRRFYNLYECF